MKGTHASERNNHKPLQWVFEKLSLSNFPGRGQYLPMMKKIGAIFRRVTFSFFMSE